jgi:hypothetical protein
MIYLVTLQAPRDSTVQMFMRALRPDVQCIECTTYEQLFRDLRIPMGHIVFSDLDMLTHYEREVVIAAADALTTADTGVHILNDPRDILERYPLLRMLERERVNKYSVTRLDGGDRPSRYPVFIRCEDNHVGVDTDLLHNDEEFDSALEELREQGKVLKRRVAIEFCAQPSCEGRYQKFGVMNVGGTLIPQHILQSEHWLVKRRSQGKTQDDIEEELAFIKENPHRESIDRIFKLACIDYGRIDYAIVDGKVQVYEINTNPNFPSLTPRPGDDNSAKVERRRIMRQHFIEAFNKLNEPLTEHRPVSFKLPEPHHYMRPWISRQRMMWMKFLNDYPSAKVLVPRRYW